MDILSSFLLCSGTGPTPPGQVLFDAQGSTNAWLVPPGVTSISILIIGKGGPNFATGHKGVGGGLIYLNNFSVTPGTTLTVKIAGGSNPSCEIAYQAKRASVTTPTAQNTLSVGSVIGISSGSYVTFSGGMGGVGGGGAAGYAGNGGDGASSGYAAGASGQGGGGGGGAYTSPGGGGTGVYGQGANGAGAESYSTIGGGGGSGGLSGSSVGGQYGGGPGGRGAVRIIWPGNLRQFPSTRTTDE